MVYLNKSDYREVIQSFKEDLKKVANSSASRNAHKYGYFAQRILMHGLDAVTSDELELLSFCYKGTHHLRSDQNKELIEKIVNLKINSNSRDIFVLYKIFFSLFCSAALKRIIVLSADINVLNVFRDPVDLYKGFPFSFCLSPVFVELLNVSSPTRCDKSIEHHSIDWAESDVYGIKYKSWNKCCCDLAKYAAAKGIKTWDEIEPRELISFRIEAKACGLGVMSFRPILTFLSLKLSNNFLSEYDNAINQPSKVGVSIERTKPQVNKNIPISNNTKVSHYKALSKGKGKELSGLPDEESAVVFVPALNSKNVLIDDYSVSLDVLKELYPEKLREETKWKLSQIDYVNFGRPEKGTKKVRQHGLRYLNLYLFDYLPFFFKSHNSVFELPRTPEEFDRHIFVEQSLVLDRAIKSEKGEKRYPLSFVDFVIRITEIQAFRTSRKNNLARDSLAVVKRYFDYVLSNLSSMEGFRFKANPLEGLPKNLGSARSRSNKRMMGVAYWINFRIYVKAISRIILAYAAWELTRYLTTISKKNYNIEEAKILTSIARRLFKDIKKSSKAVGISIKKIDFGSRFIDASKISIKIVDDQLNTKTIKLGRIDLGLIKKRSIKVTSKKVEHKIIDYQRLLHVLVGCYAGQRGSNSNWLDVDSFDGNFDRQRKYSQEEKVEMFINTDKAQEEGFYSDIEYGAFELLLFAKRLRAFNCSESFVKPISYQNNEQSKFGKIRPLLQLNARNSGLEYSLTDYVLLFEDYLRENGIDLGSNLTLCHGRVRLKEFIEYRKNFHVPEIYDCFIDYLGEGNFTRFSPVTYKTELTLHSLRKQLVSVMDVLVSDREAIGMVTGQTNVVIGYYSDLPKDDIDKIEKINSLSGLFSVVPASRHDLEERKSEVEESIINETFGEDFKPFSSPAPSDYSNGLTDLLHHECENIAYNRTHICSSGNVCPSDVIREVGERNCHICYKAVMTKFHAPAIAATIKAIIDEMAEIKELLNSTKLKNSERDDLHFRLKIIAQKSCAWHVRLSHINKHPEMMIGNKTKAVDQLSYVEPDSIGNHIVARMIEVEDTPLLQTNILKSKATKMAKGLLGKLHNEGLSNKSTSSNFMNLTDPVTLVVQNLKLLAEIKGLNADKLIQSIELEKMTTSSFLEILKDE